MKFLWESGGRPTESRVVSRAGARFPCSSRPVPTAGAITAPSTVIGLNRTRVLCGHAQRRRIVTTSSLYCRSEMRPEYLAEFEAAGVPPYSHVSFPTADHEGQRKEEPFRARLSDSLAAGPSLRGAAWSVKHARLSLMLQRIAAQDGANATAIIAGVAIVVVAGFVVPMVFMFAILRGIMKAGRQSRRRSS